MDYYENQDELYHYGRKGMKWGQHIFGEVKKAGSKVGRKVSDSWKQHREKKAAERIMSKPISKLTDAELKQRIERLKLEQNASQLMSNIRNNNSTGEGKKFMSNLKNRIGEGIADAAKATITDYAKKKLFKAFGLSDEMSEEIKQLTKEADEWGLRGKIAENMSKQLKYDKDKEDWDKNHPKGDSDNAPNNKPKSDGDDSTNKPKNDSNKPKNDSNKPKTDSSDSKDDSSDSKDNVMKPATLDTPDKKIDSTVTKDGKTYSVNTGFNLKSKTRTSHEVTRLNKALEETYSEIRKQAEATEKENKEMAGAWAGAKKSYSSISEALSERGFNSSSSPAEAIASVVSSPKKYSMAEGLAKRDARREAKSTTNTSKNRYVNMVKAMKKSGRSAEYMAKRTGLSISEIYRLLDD